MRKHLNHTGAHLQSLEGIQQHASIGRIPMLDYACEFAKSTGEPMPEPSIDLIRFLNETEKIHSDSESLTRINEAYAAHRLRPPVGIEDLPVWWAITIINELNKRKAEVVMNWDSVFLQGAFLDVQLPSPVEEDNPLWPEMGAALIRLHQNFTPGPFTPEVQLEEFF